MELKKGVNIKDQTLGAEMYIRCRDVQQGSIFSLEDPKRSFSTANRRHKSDQLKIKKQRVRWLHCKLLRTVFKSQARGPIPKEAESKLSENM